MDELDACKGQTTLLMGSVRAGFESLGFHADLGRLGPMGAVLIVPLGVAGPSDRRWNWGRKMTICGVEIGGVHCGT